MGNFLRKLQVTFLILIVPLGAFYWYLEKNDLTVWDLFSTNSQVMHIDDIPLTVKVADSDAERRQGLSGLESLEDISGLLFIFEEPDYHGIWMKDMRFPIDVIWINEDLEVVGITQNLTPDSYPRIYEPPEPVKYLLETEVSLADTFGIKLGDNVYLPKVYEPISL